MIMLRQPEWKAARCWISDDTPIASNGKMTYVSFRPGTGSASKPQLAAKIYIYRSTAVHCHALAHLLSLPVSCVLMTAACFELLQPLDETDAFPYSNVRSSAEVYSQVLQQQQLRLKLIWSDLQTWPNRVEPFFNCACIPAHVSEGLVSNRQRHSRLFLDSCPPKCLPRPIISLPNNSHQSRKLLGICSVRLESVIFSILPAEDPQAVKGLMPVSTTKIPLLFESKHTVIL